MGRPPIYRAPTIELKDRHLQDELENEMKDDVGKGLSPHGDDYHWMGDPVEPPIDVGAHLAEHEETRATLALFVRAIVKAYPNDVKNRKAEERVEEAVAALLGQARPSGRKRKISDELLNKILNQYHSRSGFGQRPTWTECIAACVPRFPKKPIPIGKEELLENKNMMRGQERETFKQRVMIRVKQEKNRRLLPESHTGNEYVEQRNRLVTEVLRSLASLGVKVRPPTI